MAGCQQDTDGRVYGSRGLAVQESVDCLSICLPLCICLLVHASSSSRQREKLQIRIRLLRQQFSVFPVLFALELFCFCPSPSKSMRGTTVYMASFLGGVASCTSRSRYDPSRFTCVSGVFWVCCLPLFRQLPASSLAKKRLRRRTNRMHATPWSKSGEERSRKTEVTRTDEAHTAILRARGGQGTPRRGGTLFCQPSDAVAGPCRRCPLLGPLAVGPSPLCFSSAGTSLPFSLSGLI